MALAKTQQPIMSERRAVYTMDQVKNEQKGKSPKSQGHHASRLSELKIESKELPDAKERNWHGCFFPLTELHFLSHNAIFSYHCPPSPQNNENNTVLVHGSQL
jgi:hypothetical protein